MLLHVSASNVGNLQGASKFISKRNLCFNVRGKNSTHDYNCYNED